MTMGAYQVLNVITLERYIGSTLALKKRWSQHKKDLRKGKHHSQRLQEAWDKYGETIFEFSTLERITDQQLLLSREQHFMDTLLPEYNTLKFAGSNLGYKFSAEAKARMSEARKGRKLPPRTNEHKIKISEAKKGVKMSEATRSKMSKSRRRVKRGPCSESTKQRIGDAQRGVKRGPLSVEHKQKIRGQKLGKPRDEQTKLKLAMTKSKIAADDIISIRRRVANGEKQKDVAAAMNLSTQAVCKIVARTTYDWVG